MKNKLKITLLLLLVFAFTVACAPANENSGEDNDIKEPETQTIDFEGEEFIFSTAEVLMPNFWPSEPKTFEDDAMRNKFNKTEQVLNCVIKKQAEVNGFEKILIAEVASNGEAGRDIVYVNSTQLYSFVKEGNIITALEDIEAIDLSDTNKWSELSRREANMYDGKTYGVPGTGSLYWPSMPIYSGCFIVNNELITRLNAPNPAEVIEKKEWTFENLKNTLPLYSDTSDADNIIYSLEIFDSGDVMDMFAITSVFANGGKLVSQNTDNKYFFGLTEKNALTALEWAAEIYAMKDNVIKAVKEKKVFAGGNASLIVTNSWRGLSTFNDFEIMRNLDNVSWHHFPYGPDVEYGKNYSSYFSNSVGTIALFTSFREQEAGIVMNELFSPLEEYGENGYFDFLKANYFHNEESFDIYKSEFMNSKYDYSNQLASVYTKIGTSLSRILQGRVTVTEAISSLTEAVNTVIDSEMNS